ncbi:Crp/Fnr family transcriptional regulator [Flaviaesturariibacter amylovorans]|uniref:Crp/Fnr family transcriptional regulator n=1 Tax=Flaviaesturariibacter amylovorans TaxID=1084520 RepID=A0ABP8HNX5_9BACT
MFESVRAYYQKLIPQLQDHEWSAIESRFTVQHLKKGELLTRQGEICRQVSFINKGLLRFFYNVDGRSVSIGFMPEGEYIAQYDSFLVQAPSKGNIDVLEDAELVNLSYTDVQELYAAYPVFQVFGRKIAEMLFMMVVSQTTSLLTLSPEERYLAVAEEEPYIIRRVPQYLIASYIGITPEHLSRLRRKLARKAGVA